MAAVRVESPNVTYTDEYIESRYVYQTTQVTSIIGKQADTSTDRTTIKPNPDGTPAAVYLAVPKESVYTFRTERKVPRLGVMLVGWGGNNGCTVTAMTLANRLRLSWHTKEGVQKANYFGSITQSSTVLLGNDAQDGSPVHVPIGAMLPMVDPNDIVFDGWDISSLNLADAMERSRVLDYHLQQQLRSHMENMRPRPSIYYPDFIAANQLDRADNIIVGDSKWEHVERLRQDIRDFKTSKQVDQVIVLWTANTERFCDIRIGLNETADELLASIRRSDPEVSQSTVFAVASILEGCSYINGSPQNTFVPGVIELADHHGVFIGGDDFKSGQTKFKSVVVDFLVSAGIKPTSIVSYNHLGNNDGKNLSAPEQFRSKEISKSNVVDDMVESNRILYEKDEHPDHCVVIKYVPYVGDSKRAMDEYVSEIAMGGHNTLVVHNTCEDSLLASPIILDLVILTELFQRVTFRVGVEQNYQRFNSVLSILSYLCKAPLVPQGTPLVNSLFRQRACIDNVMRACVGLAPINHMLLEHKHEILVSRKQHQPAENVELARNGHVIPDGVTDDATIQSSQTSAIQAKKLVINGHTSARNVINGHA